MPKGLSVEEKRSRLLEIFYETKDFFMLKEVEKMGSKKGVVLMSVKDVLQSLVDDDLVRQEKIGQSNFFWSFPSQRVVQRKNAIAKLEAEKEALAARLERTKEALAQEEDARAGDDRGALIQEYERLCKERDGLDGLLEKQGRCDPVKYEEKSKRLEAMKSETNDLTEKLFTVQDYVCRKFNVDRKEFCESFGIDEALDYVQ